MRSHGRFAALAELEEEEKGEPDKSVNDETEQVLSSVEPLSPGLGPHGFLRDHAEIPWPGSPRSNEVEDDDFEPDVICNACQAIFPAEGSDEPRLLRVDVANPLSCRLCETLLRYWGSSHHCLDLKCEFEAREGYSSGVLDVVFREITPSSQSPRVARFGFQRYNGTDISFPPSPPFTVDLPASTQLKDCIKQAGEWLKSCEDHSPCNEQLSSWSGFVPTRLIEISRDKTQSIKIRLKSRSELDPRVKYVALSHCWGSFMPVKLEESKLHQFRRRIPWHNISPVFRDAITVSEALGIYYIWIDSLCIIQDSSSDWKTESAKMCDVYSCCHLNIAADASHDGSQGLFRERNAALLRPIHMVVRKTDNNRANNGYRRFSEMEPGNYLLFDIHCWKDEVDDGPLGKRGWVLQERALSPRTLHFGKTQVAWECRHFICSEVFPAGFVRGTRHRRAKNYIAAKYGKDMPMEVYQRYKHEQDKTDQLLNRQSHREISSDADSEDDDDQLAPQSRQKKSPERDYIRLPSNFRPYTLVGVDAMLLQQLRLPPHTKNEIQRWTRILSPSNLEPPRHRHMTAMQKKWCRIVSAYTECSLSYGSDKLVAVAGLAEMMSQYTKCQYLTGLWRKDLEHWLLWKVTSPLPAASQDGTRGPSWSWPSVDGGVKWQEWAGWGHGNYQWLCCINSVRVQTTADNPFGQVASGTLCISGPLKVLHITNGNEPKPDSTQVPHLGDDAQSGVDLFWNTKDLLDQFGDGTSSIVWQHNTYAATRTRYAPSNGDLFFMPFRIMDSDYLGADYEAPILEGLLLLPLLDEPRGIYRRVGQLTISKQRAKDSFKGGEGETPFQPKREWPFQPRTRILDTRLYRRTRTNGEYTILVV